MRVEQGFRLKGKSMLTDTKVAGRKTMVTTVIVFITSESRFASRARVLVASPISFISTPF